MFKVFTTYDILIFQYIIFEIKYQDQSLMQWISMASEISSKLKKNWKLQINLGYM